MLRCYGMVVERIGSSRGPTETASILLDSLGDPLQTHRSLVTLAVVGADFREP